MTDLNDLDHRIQSLWRHGADSASLNAGNRTSDETGQFLSRLQTRRRAAFMGLMVVAIAFGMLTAVSVGIYLTQDDLDFRHAVLFLLVNTVLWTGWFAGHWFYQRADSMSIVPGMSVIETLRAGHAQVMRHRNQLSLIAGGLFLSIPLVAWSLWLMVQQQRVEADEVPWRIGFASIAYAIAFACIVIDRFGRNRRERIEIERLIADVQEANR